MAPKQQHALGLPLVVLMLSASAMLCNGAQSNWTHWGGDLNNRRFSDHSCLDFSVGGFTKKWSFPTTATVLATPSVCGGHVYFVDNSVKIYKLTLAGKLVWSIVAKTLIPNQSVGIRASPVMSPDCQTMYLFTQWTKGSWIIALSTTTGTAIYKRNFDTHPLSRMTQTPVLLNGVIYLGTSSMSEGSVTSQTSFRGSMFALYAASGAQKWRTWTCPQEADGLYTGCAIWGSSPVVDVRRKQVCTGTGNNYEVPAKVRQCLKAAGANMVAQRNCASKNNLGDAMVCFDMDTGKVKWARTMNGVDLYLPGSPDMGLDLDFAQGPIMIHKGNPNDDVLIATNKNGIPVGFNPISGTTKWKSPVIADGGFAMFGSCTNNKAYCMGLFWYSQKKGVVACLDVTTGQRISTWNTGEGGVYGPLTCTQRYVFVPLMDVPGSLVALEIATGKQVGKFPTGTTLFCGPAIVNGVAYVGSGYTANGGVGNKVIHALGLPMKGAC